jgi:dihydrofolate reductase
MRKIIVTEWLTLDGAFDADPKHFEKWFLPYHSEARAQHIQRNILGCGALLMGRMTYEALAPYWSPMKNNEMGVADKMNATEKHVVCSTLKRQVWNNTKGIFDGNVMEEIARLKQSDGDCILVPGSATLVHSMMAKNLIDEFRFLVHPIVLGPGRRFFAEGMPTTRLDLVRSEALDLGVVELCYQPSSS